MTPRLDLMKNAPKSIHSLMDLTNTIAASRLEKNLQEVVKIRAPSQAEDACAPFGSQERP
jgi:hypothetical protein